MIVCEWCGQSFERPHPEGMRPKFCSVICRTSAQADRRRLSKPAGPEKIVEAVALNGEGPTVAVKLSAGVASTLSLYAASRGRTLGEFLTDLADDVAVKLMGGRHE